MNPEATVNLRPTGYWNVFSVDTTEYVEPQAVEFAHALVLGTRLYAVRSQQAVWGIESSSEFSIGIDRARDYSVITREARTITKYLSRDGLIVRQGTTLLRRNLVRTIMNAIAERRAVVVCGGCSDMEHDRS